MNQSDDDIGIVLVHGSTLGSWCWDDLLPHLDLPTLAVDLPGRSATAAERRQLTWEANVEALADDIRSWRCRRVILLGHSAAGFVIPEVAARLPERVAHLVFLAAVIPPEGKGAIDTLPLGYRSIARACALLGVDFRPPKGAARQAIGYELTEEQVERVMRRSVVESTRALPRKLSYRHLPPTLPRSYILCTGDRAILPQRQREFARTITADIIEADAGHSMMMSQPERLAAIINELASGSVQAGARR